MDFEIKVIKASKYCYIKAVIGGVDIGEVCVDLNSEDDARFVKRYSSKFAKIVLVHTSEKYTRRGVASALLNKTIEVLKDYNLYLYVIPSKRNSRDKDKDQLVSFYSKFGFERTDDILMTTMVRIAK
jgi:ribosomal protein S18 acetylase RimI-like enzyme